MDLPDYNFMMALSGLICGFLFALALILSFK